MLNNAYGGLFVVSDGVSKWTSKVMGISIGGTGATTAAASGEPPRREVVRAAALAASWRALLEPVEHLTQPAPVKD